MAQSTQLKSSSKPRNKLKRQAAYLKLKKARESAKRDQRFRRKREEDRNPRLRVERRARNVPVTIERKRVWDDVEAAAGDGDGIGLSVDVADLKRRKIEHSQDDQAVDALTESNLKRVEAETSNRDGQVIDDSADSFFQDEDDEQGNDDTGELDDISDEDQQGSNHDRDADTGEVDDDLASLLDSEQDESIASGSGNETGHASTLHSNRAPSLPASTASTNLSLIPDALAAKFPSLFNAPDDPPKILITTTLHGAIHAQAETLTTLFPNSNYIRRSRHKHNSHKFSLGKIAQFAHNRSYTAMIVLEEDHKRPSGLTIIHLPSGPTFHFSITNWVDGTRLPGHGRATNHHPELLLNNFRTPLGLLTASLFRTLFPPAPEIQGRQVVTLHNQRDYIFVRRHRYVFRDRKPTEKSVNSSTDGSKPKDNPSAHGLDDIKTGLQELGPRFTLKLRRIDRGIQRTSGQEWEWKTKMDKVRTRFQL